MISGLYLPGLTGMSVSDTNGNGWRMYLTDNASPLFAGHVFTVVLSNQKYRGVPPAVWFGSFANTSRTSADSNGLPVVVSTTYSTSRRSLIDIGDVPVVIADNHGHGAAV